MSKSDLRKVRLRFVILAVVIAVCAIVSNRHIASIGAVYEYPLEGYPGAKASDLRVSTSPDDLAEVTEVRDGPNHMPVAVIHGKKPGEGMLLVNEGDEVRTQNVSL